MPQHHNKARPPPPPPKPAKVLALAASAKASRNNLPIGNDVNMKCLPRKVRAVPPCSTSTIGLLWKDEHFLNRFFWYFSAAERRTLAQVCHKWKEVLYQPKYWRGLVPVVRCRELRGWRATDDSDQDDHVDEEDLMAEPRTSASPLQITFFTSLQQRGFDALCLVGACDDDVYHLLAHYPPAARHTHSVALRSCSISDKVPQGLEALLDGMRNVYQLELSGCNEVTEAGLWAGLTPRIVSLTIADCLNVADDSLGAVAQLPSLYELDVQAYHVTDAALAYFGGRQHGASLAILRLRSCWEITDRGVATVARALPSLAVLSVSGCSKVSDVGVEALTHHLRSLRSLDLSWCPRITDAALECIACDLAQLQQLTLDRCVQITDIGLGYLSTMTSLTSLFLRWCTQIRDFGLQHLCGMRNLQVLSVAGCPLLTAGGLSSLIQLRQLQELELTNCPGTSEELCEYLRSNMPKCLIIE